MTDQECKDCGASRPRTSLSGVPVCDRCADRRAARITGFPELPDPPAGIVLSGPDGRQHQLSFRIWRAPTGVEVELEEQGVPAGEGFAFAALGAHDADVDELIAHVRRRAESEISRPYLEPDRHGHGWQLRGDEVAGRLISGREYEAGAPYDVVVDGETLSWDELGQALAPFEGWRFRLVIEDRCDDLRPDAELIALVPARELEAIPMPAPTGSPTIDEVLAEFLAEQEKRLAPRTFRNYADIISLLRDCLNGYGQQSLDTAERKRWEQAYKTDEAAFVHVFGPDKIDQNLGEFLGYFMIRKVIAGEELLRAAGTVTKKLGRWLGEHGYLDAAAADLAVECGADAARELPKAAKLAGLLFEQSQKTLLDVHALDDGDYVEDYLMIDRVESGALWFEGGIGPVKVPKAASDIAKPGWSVNIVLGRTGEAWHIVEVGNVYP